MDNISFSELYTQYYKRSFLFAKSYVRDEMAAEDIASESLIQLWETLASLPEQTRRIFIMSRYEQMSVKEIAEKQQLTPKSVEYHITKSLKVLRVALKDYLPVLWWFL